MPLSRTALTALLAVCLHSQPSPKSLTVDGIDEEASGFYLRLRNTSFKDVLGYSLTIGDRSSSFQVSSTPLVAARSSKKLPIQNATIGPGMGPLVLRAALFADGSYEGDPAAAAALVIPVMAADVERRRIVMTLEPMIADGEPPPFEEVRRRVSAVTTHMDVVSVLEMSERFPSLGDFRESPFRTRFEQAAKSQKEFFLRKLDETGKGDGVSFKGALIKLTNDYAHEQL